MSMIGSQQKGQFPSDTIVNPKEQCKAISVRSGKEITRGVPKEEVLSSEVREKMEEEPVLQQCEKEEKKKKGSNIKTILFSDNPPILQPPLPYPQRFQKKKLDEQFAKFLEIFKKIHINIPFANALEQMPNYIKFMKEVMSRKQKLEEFETVKLTEECSAILQKKLPQKVKDPGSFTIPCTIGKSSFDKALCDLSASINLMPLSVFKKLGLGEVKPTTISLQLANRSLTYPRGVIEDVLVKVDKLIFPTDFIVLDMEEDKDIPIILGRPFLATGNAIINVPKGELSLQVENEKVIFNVFQALKDPSLESCHKIDTMDMSLTKESQVKITEHPKTLCHPPQVHKH